MKINSDILKMSHEGRKNRKIFWAKCGMFAEFAEMAYDRTEAGEKNTQEGILRTNKRITDLGFGEIKRIQRKGTVKEYFYKGKKESCVPTIECLGFYNDTDIFFGVRGTHNDAGWAQNKRTDKVRTKKGNFHQGWHEDVEEIFEEAVDWITSIPHYRSKRLNTYGHSKGAPESQQFSVLIDSIVPIDLNISMATPKGFCPKTARQITKDFSGRMFWVKHNNDIVCRVPPFGFNQAGKMIYITAGGKVKFKISGWNMFWDAVWGRFIDIPDLDWDSIEDHHDCYYINAFYKAAGSDRRVKRWENKYV